MNEHGPPRVLGLACQTAHVPRAGEPAVVERRFLGMVVRHQPDKGAEEPQRVMGVPVAWFEGVDREFFSALRHPLATWRRRGSARE